MCVLSLVEILPLVLLVRLGLVAKHVYVWAGLLLCTFGSSWFGLVWLWLYVCLLCLYVGIFCAGTNNDPTLPKCRLISISFENGVLAQEN